MKVTGLGFFTAFVILAPMAMAQNVFKSTLEPQVTTTRTAKKQSPVTWPDDWPPQGFFNGVYDMIGRDDYAAQVDMRVKIEQAGDLLQVTSCDTTFTMALAPEPAHEVRYVLATYGDNAIDTMLCPFYSDGDNYPILTCRGAEYTRITLWPVPDVEIESCAPF